MRTYKSYLSANTKEVLALVAIGDKRAFKLLYDHYSSKTFSFAYRILNDVQSAEEVMQETMLKIWLLGNKLNEIDHIDAYIKTISRNYCYSLLRRDQLKNRINNELAHEWSEAEETTEQLLLAKEAKKILSDAVSRLPDYYQKVYRLCYQEGKKYEEVAEELQLSPHTVKTYMKHALRSIRKHLAAHSEIPILFIIFKLF